MSIEHIAVDIVKDWKESHPELYKKFLDELNLVEREEVKK